MKWICSDPDCDQYVQNLSDGVYEFYQIIAFGSDDGDDRFAVIHDVVEIDKQRARTPEFINMYLKPFGYSDVDEIRHIYAEEYMQIIAECIFETDSCTDSSNHIRYGTFEFCEGYIAAKIETR